MPKANVGEIDLEGEDTTIIYSDSSISHRFTGDVTVVGDDSNFIITLPYDSNAVFTADKVVNGDLSIKRTSNADLVITKEITNNIQSDLENAPVHITASTLIFEDNVHWTNDGSIH